MKQRGKQKSKFTKVRLDILYEDSQILLVNKPVGMIVHPNDSEQTETLLNHVREYLYRTGAWNAADCSAFRPAPCNRLDRFTTGIIIIAKTWEAMRLMNRKIQQREVEKKYLCVVKGCPKSKNGKIENYLLKNQDETYVTAHKRQMPGSQYACMEYRTLSVRDKTTLLECTLITGRTHQIRVQLAGIGCPVLGDMRYGDKRFNQQQRKHHQVLCAYQITFTFETDAGVLNYLKGKTFQIKRKPKL